MVQLEQTEEVKLDDERRRQRERKYPLRAEQAQCSEEKMTAGSLGELMSEMLQSSREGCRRHQNERETKSVPSRALGSSRLDLECDQGLREKRGPSMALLSSRLAPSMVQELGRNKRKKRYQEQEVPSRRESFPKGKWSELVELQSKVCGRWPPGMLVRHEDEWSLRRCRLHQT